MSSEEQHVLALVSEMKRVLARAATLEEVIRVRNETEAVRCLVQKAKLGLEMHNEAAEFKLRAERKAGEMLASAAQPGRKPTKRYHSGTFKLGELGITKNQSSRWQRQAAVPEQEFEAYLQESRQAQREVTSAELLRRAGTRRIVRQRTVQARRNGDAYEINLLPAKTAALSASGNPSLKELVADLKNHRALLESILLPYCQHERPIKPAARAHAVRLFATLATLLDEAELMSNA